MDSIGTTNIIIVHKKPSRYRSPTWTDDEIHKLFHVWSQPNIHKGFLSQRKKQEVFAQMSEELKKIGVERTLGECQTKIKNLKGDFKRAKEQGVPQTFKFYTILENILRPKDQMMEIIDSKEQEDEDSSLSETEGSFVLGQEFQDQSQDIMVSTNDTIMDDDPVEVSGHNQPVQIEFQLMSSVDFHNMKESQLPIEIGGGNIRIPHEYVSEVDTIIDEDTLHDGQTQITMSENHHDHFSQQETVLTTDGAMQGVTIGPDGTPLIVITTRSDTHTGILSDQFVQEDSHANIQHLSEGPSTPSSQSFSNQDPGGQASKRKLNALEISHKRRKLNSMSEKMAETVERILTKTTNSLIDEMKASEERFMKWEEKRREEEHKREEQMIKKLVEAINSKPGQQGTSNQSTRARGGLDYNEQANTLDMLRIQEMIRSSNDPCAVTFDLLATKLTKILNDQTRETEQDLYEWESEMQRKETRHTDNLFNILISAVKNPHGAEL